ncbi:MAG: hypothetical protein ABWY18_09510 [Tardiphaga sp.]
MFRTLFRFRDRADIAVAAPGLAYAYKASLIGAAHRYELTDHGLAWRTGRRSGVWAYADIATIRLSYRPMGMQQNRFRADVDHVDGRHITIFSTSKQTVALMEPQAGYAGFIVNLHDKMAAVQSPAALRAGLRPGIYNTIVTVLALLALAMTALLVRAVWTGEWAGAAFVVAFSVLFAWQIRGFLRRNRPRSYTFVTVPGELLR